MTYAAFGYAIQYEQQEGTYQPERWWSKGALICLDELSQGVHQAYYEKDMNPTMFALQELVKRTRDKSNIVVTLSATPKPAVNYFKFWNNVDINVVKSTLGLHGYETKTITEYTDLDSLLMSLDDTQRGLIFISTIERIISAVSLLESRGIHAVGIWSTKNKDHPLNEEQQEAIRSLVSDEKLPEDIQVLIMNTAYETGLNIRPEKSRLDYIVVHNSNDDTVTQVRGRYRGDLDTLYRRVKPDGYDEFIRPIDNSLIAPFLGMRLGNNEKNELCEALNLKDRRGRLKGWTSVKKLLENNGFTVEQHRDRNARWDVIHYAPDDENV